MQSVHADPLTGRDVDRSEFRQNAVRVELTGDPDTDTDITAKAMCQFAKAAPSRNPMVPAAARDAIKRFGSIARNPAEACFWWCKHAMRFRHHGEQCEVWSPELGDPAIKLQLLIAPDVLLRMRKMEGDCAIYTMMVCAMLEALGISWRICPCAVNHSQPTIFSHVFARAIFPDGKFESLDASHGPAPGWQVPSRDMIRLWVFDESGRRISEQGQGFAGLHDYRPSRYRRRGMGAQVCDDSGCYDDGTGTGPDTTGGYYNPTQVFGPGVGTPPAVDWSGIPQMSGGYQAPSQNSAQWAQFASNLAKMGFTLAQINSIQPGTVVGANGQILRQNPGYAVPGFPGITANIGASSSGLVLIGVGVVALLAFASMFKGGR